MKKKKSMKVNSKIVFTITLVFVFCCILSTNSWAAKRVKFYKSNTEDFVNLLNQEKSSNGKVIGWSLGLSEHEEFKLERQQTDFNNNSHSRYQQLYQGIPVWGMQTVVSRNPMSEVIKIHGEMVLDTPNDVTIIPPVKTLDPKVALEEMKAKHMEQNPGAQWNFSNEKAGTYIYIDKKGKAHLAYVVSFFVDDNVSNASYPIHFIEVKTGRVLDSYDMFSAVGTGPGGNNKIDQYEYGTDYPGFGVTVNGSTYTMNTTNVKTVDLNHGGDTTSVAYSYIGPRNTHKEINGGYCPLNDAQYFGQVVYNMYSSWYGTSPVPFQLVLKVHYLTNYENARWTGSSALFGDGYTRFYPLVGLDVVGHEFSHGFTQFNSNLIYSGQSGGINEAFSDMAGEACEKYMRGTNDFKVGNDIKKIGALRYMYNPPLDGVSIDHVNDYYSGMDPHYSSGIFNKAFYLIASSWGTQKAFKIFVRANQIYWTPSTNFQQGAEGALDAAMDYGYDCNTVKSAFNAVGISLTCPPQTSTFQCLADTFVRQDDPDANFGSSTLLRSRGSATGHGIHPFLKFTVYGVSVPIQSAKLRIKTQTAFPVCVLYHMKDNTWQEYTLTWNTRNMNYYSYKNVGALSANVWYEFDVKSFVTGNGTYTFFMAASNVAGQAFYSRQSSNKPTLIVTY